jgi:tripartite-type tricarboxylate transporter receptor subunit TctC
MRLKRFFAASMAPLAALAIGVAPAFAQEYPAKPVRLIVPTAPGGMADILARLYAQNLGDKTRQPIVVENRTGAGGVIAAEAVAKAPADGYTLYLGFHATNAILPILDPELPYDAAKDSRRCCTSPACPTCWW